MYLNTTFGKARRAAFDQARTGVGEFKFACPRAQGLDFEGALAVAALSLSIADIASAGLAQW